MTSTISVNGYVAIDSIHREGQSAALAQVLGVADPGASGVLVSQGLRVGFLAAGTADDPDHGTWRQITWLVADLAAAAAALSDAGVAMESNTADEIVIAPSALGGLRLRLVDSAAVATEGSSANPLGIAGIPTIKVATPDPRAAAETLARLIGGTVVEAESQPLNMLGFGVVLADHSIEFVGSKYGSHLDLVATFLAAEGPGIYCVELDIQDFDRARTYLVDEYIRFSQYGPSCMRIEAETTRGALLELDA